jgi:hypothetical protein
MRYIDGDLKKSTDELNEAKNNLAQMSKGKDSNSFLQKDLGDIIYNTKIDPDTFFVEAKGSEALSTFIAIVHK